MILGAATTISEIGSLKFKQIDNYGTFISYHDDWLIYNGIMNGFRPFNLWLRLLPHNGRNVTLTWLYGDELENSSTVTGTFDFSEMYYRMLPNQKSRRIPEAWNGMKVHLTSTLTDDESDPAVLTVYGYADKSETNDVIVTLCDGTQVDLLQTLTDNGFLDVPIDLYILSEQLSNKYKKVTLRSREDGLFVDHGKSRDRNDNSDWVDIQRYYVTRYSAMGDKVLTCFTFRIRS